MKINNNKNRQIIYTMKFLHVIVKRRQNSIKNTMKEYVLVNGFMKQRKRLLAGVMALLMVLSTVLSYDIVAFAASEKQTIAAWEQVSVDDYKNVPYKATTGNADRKSVV